MERKEAIEIARKLYNESLFLKKDKEAMVTLIPELAESEDERIRKDIISLVIKWWKDDGEVESEFSSKNSMLDWLEKRGEQKPTEWSEEDEKTVHLACEFIRHHSKPIDSIGGIDCSILIERLKSLKDRYTWKPSNKQIMALRWVLNNIPYCNHKEEINGLLEQIKEL